MGSSKKHKGDKDRERRSDKDREHKSDKDREHRSDKDREHRSDKDREHRSDKDREHKRKRRHRSKSQERRRHEKTSRSGTGDGSKRMKYDQEAEYVQSEDMNLQHEDSVATSSAQNRTQKSEATTDSGGALALSIEETNKLRAKLGLKPLDVPGTKEESDETKNEDVHVPATNLGELRNIEKLREKVRQQKEKRRLHEKFGKMKPLAAASSEEDDDSAAAWVEQNRKLEKDRILAENMAKELEKVGSEFGIGNLVTEEFEKKKLYGSKDLKGLKVQHCQESFAEGRTVILTLKDKGVLDDDEEDTLINVNMIDDEHAAKNVENRKKKPDYQPYDEPEYDEFGVFKPKEILSKYDEDISGPNKESFELGGGGRYTAEHERFLQRMKTEIEQQKQELSLAPPKLASEFYTPDEMSSFKKTKKKDRSIRKKTRLTADDLLATVKEEPIDLRDPGVDMKDLSKSSMKKEAEPAMIPGLDLVTIKIENDVYDDGTAEGMDDNVDFTGVMMEEDKLALELELSLKKARNVKLKKVVAPEKLALTNEETPVDDYSTSDNSLVLNATHEFCIALGEIPTYGTSGHQEENDEEMMDNEIDAQHPSRNDADDDELATGWQSVEIDTRPVDLKTEDKAVLDDEPVVNQGLAAALQLAQKKGYLTQEVTKVASASRNMNLEGQNYSIEDKRYDDLDEKYRKRGDRYTGGMTMEFKEKEGYKPNIKLEYIDSGGRQMTPREAFRSLSHSFHGKGSGKKKTEKRMKKIQDEQLMNCMSSTDTPLNTVHLLQQKQKSSQTPYVILSGGKGIAANTIAK